ncbi:hypothetical protein BG74_09320 [Sodalis-like endosymbiont of Proechinophthirus fluctus]|nr:hypothetical protein BG74_09320 [Sodalis-like endosymbiont of Proechinophthirus fluctus]
MAQSVIHGSTLSSAVHIAYLLLDAMEAHQVPVRGSKYRSGLVGEMKYNREPLHWSLAAAGKF